ncbi:hypothetical protein [Skermania sp. ID1734]|uniref:hypothetical protein n=1 Tax=Skermania sp. ID1734 TaxID=2597516 RepID=UPI00351B3D5C
MPELLLCGHLIDRSGMAQLIGALGREGMTAVAIEEWAAASPIYTRRMQDALNFRGDSVETIFKGLQFDIGAPPQFMDFRFRVDDHDHGEFWLDHCGALMDVEVLGDEYVTAMCHDIEDPTFDATAAATNPHAQVRPIHRPPRRPPDRVPNCAWRVTIDPLYEPQSDPPHAEALAESHAARFDLVPIDPADSGRSDYTGPLLSDVRFADFSASALVRIADEICLQQHLLTLGFTQAVRARTTEADALAIGRRQFGGIAGLTAERIRRALGLGRDLEALVHVLRVHPAVNPAGYGGVSIAADGPLRLRIAQHSPAQADGGWLSLLGPDHLDPLDALVRGVDARFYTSVVAADEDALTIQIDTAATPFPEATEVALTRFSSGANFQFNDGRIPLPLTVGVMRR